MGLSLSPARHLVFVEMSSILLAGLTTIGYVAILQAGLVDGVAAPG